MKRADRPYDPARPDGGRYRLSEELPFVHAMIWGFAVLGALAHLGWVSGNTPLPLDMFEDGLVNNRPVGFLVGGVLAIVAAGFAGRAIEALSPPPEPKSVLEQASDEAAGALEKFKTWWSQ